MQIDRDSIWILWEIIFEFVFWVSVVIEYMQTNGDKSWETASILFCGNREERVT